MMEPVPLGLPRMTFETGFDFYLCAFPWSPLSPAGFVNIACAWNAVKWTMLREGSIVSLGVYVLSGTYNGDMTNVRVGYTTGGGGLLYTPTLAFDDGDQVASVRWNMGLYNFMAGDTVHVEHYVDSLDDGPEQMECVVEVVFT